MYAGAAYLVPTGPSEKNHLHVVIVNPSSSGIVLWVSICSIKNGIHNDSSCEFSGGEHEFITAPSYVAYNFLGKVRVDHIRKMESLNYYKKKADVSSDVLKVIIEGLNKTDEAPKGVEKAFYEWPED